VQPGQGPPADLLSLDGGRLEVDLARHEVRVDTTPVVLTASEFRLLGTLCRQPGRVFSRFELMEAMHGQDVEGFERTVDAHVKNLRRKLDEGAPDAGRYVATVYGVGYRLSEGR
jgi:DNA-binding response OmpR family regulator